MVTLVLLPGMDGTGSLLEDFAASFGPEVEVVIASYPTDKALGYDELEIIARSFLPNNRPFFLLAESFSGPIAISIAASKPQGLLGLILCCSFARNPLPLLSLARPLIAIFPVKLIPISLTSKLVLGRFLSNELRSALAEAINSVSADVLRARIRAILSIDVSHLLRQAQTPILYLRATKDRLVPKSSSDHLVSMAPGARVIEFEAPHFLLQVLPSVTASVVIEFMDKARSDSGSA